MRTFKTVVWVVVLVSVSFNPAVYAADLVTPGIFQSSASGNLGYVCHVTNKSTSSNITVTTTIFSTGGSLVMTRGPIVVAPNNTDSVAAAPGSGNGSILHCRVTTSSKSNTVASLAITTAAGFIASVDAR